jgi:hypothetical protein
MDPSETGNDKGIESTIGNDVKNEIGMIKIEFHFIHRISELSFREICSCLVINVGSDICPADFNTKISREIVAKPSAIDGRVFQILTTLEEIVPCVRIHFNGSGPYLGESRQG